MKNYIFLLLVAILVMSCNSDDTSSTEDTASANLESKEEHNEGVELLYGNWESDEDLANYLWENVFNNYEWYDNETNKEVYGEDAAYDLSFEMCEGMEEYFDSRTKGEDAWVQVGVPNPEWTKYGGFQVTAEGKYNSEL